MAIPSLELVRALRLTAARIEDGGTFQWSHHGSCNCGNLAQTITGLDAGEVYRAAYARPGDWGEQAREHCVSSGLPMDAILGRMRELGMGPDDVRHLERLSDPAVTKRVPPGRGPLWHARREDAVLYMRLWADLLAEQLPHAEEPPAERRAA